MAEEAIVTADTSADETVVLEETTDGTEDVGTLREKLARAEEAKRQIHARALRAEKALKEKPVPPVNKEYSLNDEVVDLRLDGYSKQDVEFIMKNGGRKVLDDKTSYVTIALNTKREQAKAEAEANKVTDTTGMSEIERKYTPEQLKNMPLAELKKIVPHA
jgi:hypothetical protein